ncbi:MAG: 50S ribosomal protein L18 [Thermodesulfobacteriota bacteirum]|nr:50S ribosomal protein L18 [Thermodesulfobacteriota bacterium]
MIKPIDKNKLRITRHKRNRKNISGTSSGPRLYIFKSLKNLYVNLVDDKSGNTLISVSTLKTDRSDIVNEIAKKAETLGIKKLVFDKSGYKFHGRIKIIADELRSKGLNF